MSDNEARADSLLHVLVAMMGVRQPQPATQLQAIERIIVALDEAEQRGRAAALEEAAAKCLRVAALHERALRYDQMAAGEECAAAIRALVTNGSE